MANTWDEHGRLRDSIAERHIQRQREMYEQQIRQDSLDYFNRERTKQENKEYRDHMNREYHKRNK